MKKTDRRSKLRGSMREANANSVSRKGGFTYLELPKGKSISFFNPEPKKKYHIDVIPFEVTKEGDPQKRIVGEINNTRIFYIHKQIGVNNENITCPKSFGWGAPCPICEERDTLARNSKEEIALRSSKRMLFQVYVHEEADKGIQLYSVSYHLFGKLLKTECEIEVDYNAYADADEGYTLKVAYSAEPYQGREYAVAHKIDFIEREPLSDELLDASLELDEILKVLSYDELYEKFHGYKPDDEDEEDIEMEYVEDDIEDEEENIEEDVENIEPTPPRRRSRR